MPSASGSLSIDCWNRVSGYQVGALAHLFQQHTHCKYTAHGIAVRARVRADQKALAFAQHLQDFSNWGYRKNSRRLA